MSAPTEKFLRENCAEIRNAYVVNVTPAIAAEWLAANTDNRPVKPGNQADLERTLRAGLWRLTHQGVCFRSDGVLLDGQHRLRAIVAAGIPALLTVFIGWEKEANDGVDLIAKRSLRDILRQDSRLLEPAAFLARGWKTPTYNSRAIPGEVEQVIAKFGNSIVALIGGTGGRVKTRTVAPVVAGAVLRHHWAGTYDRDYVAAQWRAFVHLDLDTLSKSVGRLLRRLEGITESGAKRQEIQFVCSWIAFDPGRKNSSRIIVDASDFAAARSSIIAAMEGEP